MKKFFLYISLVLFVLGSIFSYILYSEGAFDGRIQEDTTKVEPFMKCQAGKCGEGKCGS